MILNKSDGLVIGLLALLLTGSAWANDPICLEAETATNIEAPMQIGSSTNESSNPKWKPIKGASGDHYLEIVDGVGCPPKLSKGRARIDFAVPEKGRYYLWARVWWAGECGNSISMSIDRKRTFAFGQDGTYKSWHWVRASKRLKQLQLTAGKHVLAIKNREDGIRIDQILFTRDRRFVPVGIEDVRP